MKIYRRDDESEKRAPPGISYSPGGFTRGKIIIIYLT